MEIKRCSVDRVVEGLAGLVCDDGAVYHLDAKKYGLAANDVLDLTVEGKTILSVKSLPEIKDERFAKNQSRLRSLFSKNKNK